MLGLVGLIALPLAALTAVSRPRDRTAVLVGLLAALFAGAWLAQPGTLPEQVVRASAVIAVSAFVLTTALTRWTVTHRALISIAIAGGAVSTSFAAFGWGFDRLHWWVAHRTGYALRFVLSGLTQAARDQGDGQISGTSATVLGQFEALFDQIVRLSADLFPATVALQLFVGLGLAAALYYRTNKNPIGRPPGRFRTFRFSEHLGWGAAIPLLVMLVPRLGAAKLLAANLLTVAGALYVLRGVAVLIFVLQLVRAGVLLYGLVVLALFFMLPVVLGSALVLGVLDAGLDLRRRWTTPRTRE